MQVGALSEQGAVLHLNTLKTMTVQDSPPFQALPFNAQLTDIPE
jgi:hypothetical protein